MDVTKILDSGYFGKLGMHHLEKQVEVLLESFVFLDLESEWILDSCLLLSLFFPHFDIPPDILS